MPHSPIGDYDKISIAIFNEFYETALFKDGHLVYIDELGYDDVLRFSTLDDLFDEMDRLAPCANQV